MPRSRPLRLLRRRRTWLFHPLPPDGNALDPVGGALNSVGGQLRVWIEFNREGKWDDPNDPNEDAEDVFRPNTDPNDPQDDELAGALPTGPDRPDLAFVVPADAIGGVTFARVRFSTKDIPGPTGRAPDDEVEDHVVWTGRPGRQDFGDAPEPYPTRLVDNGARHVPGLPCLGHHWDDETDGQPNPSALGDDNNPSANDDEDRVQMLTPWAAGQPARARIHVTTGHAPTAARLDAWADFNQDGDWTDAGERILDHHPVNHGINILRVAIPAHALPGRTFVRFRISWHGLDAPTGEGGPGEVEDYAVMIHPQPVALESLTLRPAGEIELRWPAALSGFRLQQAPTLGGPWTDVSITPVQQGDSWTLRIAPTGTMSFWRLVSP